MTELRVEMVKAGLLGAIALLLGTAVPAVAQSDDVKGYIKFEGGYIFRYDSEVREPVFTTDVEMQSGQVGNVAAGYYFTPRWRGELSAGYETSDVNGVDNNFQAEGDIRAYTLMANVYRDFAITRKLRTYIGGGLGAIVIDPDYRLQAIGRNFVDNKDLNVAVQGTAGVAVALSRGITFDTRYRYLYGGKYDFGTGDGTYKNHAVLAGLRINFGHRPKPAAPAPVLPAPVRQEPPPPPPPAPEEPPIPRDLLDLVFFPFDSYAITAEAGEVLDRAAETIRQRNIELIRLEGHTDTVGTSEYNLRLSRRRAEAVRNGLIERGVPPTNVYISAKGESDLRVETADEVKNQSNRYVQIFVRFTE